MCGIAGYVDMANKIDDHPEVLGKMASVMVSRGPDGVGGWYDRGVGVGLAHRRLAVLDLSPNGHQPMVSRDGRWVVVFNGEVYNHAWLRKQLAEAGGITAFRGTSDTEVVLECVARWGVAAVEKFAGMFALAFWDRETRCLHLVRDRIGIKPLFFSSDSGSLVFGSDLGSMAQCPLLDAGIDHESVAQFLKYNYVPSPRTIFRQVSAVEPGTIHSFDFKQAGGGRSTRLSYWSPSDLMDSSDLILGDSEAEKLVEEAIRKSVRARMLADVPVGAFLSGGVDSSLVAGIMQQESASRIKTFTIGFEEPGFDEASAARAFAKNIGSDHTEFYFSAQDALDRIPLLPKIFDQPFADSSQLPMLLVSQLAREQVTVALSGDGGDELFGGYARYSLVDKLWKALDIWPSWLRSGMGAGIERAPDPALDFLGPLVRRALPAALAGERPANSLRKAVKFLRADSLADCYDHFIGQWSEPHRIVTGVPAGLFPEDEPWWSHGTRSNVEKMMFHDFCHYLRDDILVKVDRCTMSVSLEGRVPLLDHEVVELAWKLPLTQKGGAALTKKILRNMRRRLFNVEDREEPKRGFSVPVGDWLSGPLRPWAESLLSKASIEEAGLLDTRAVRAAWDGHLSGEVKNDARIWGVLMLQGWLQDRAEPSPGAHWDHIEESRPWLSH